MKTKSTLLLIALVVAGSAACLIAQDGGNNTPHRQGRMAPDEMGPRGHRPPPIIATLDANHDGVIDADEIANASVALLKLDKNGDGQLTPEELHPPRPMGGDASDHQGPPPFGRGGHGHPPFDEQDGPPADAPEQN